MEIRVLHLITELNIGGAEKALARLLARMDRERFALTVACLYGGDGPVADEIRRLDIPVIDLGMTAKWRWDALLRLYRLLRRVRPAILHTWMFHANISGRISGRLAGIPIVISGERTMGMESRWRYWLNRTTDPLTDRVICVSQRVADFVEAHVGIPHNKIVVIPNGIDIPGGIESPDPKRVLNRQQARQDLKLPADQVLVGTVARLEPVKRLDVLLHALTALPDVHALLVGDGPERGRLISLSEQLNLEKRVHLAGQQTYVWPWLAAIDVFVLCSDWEGMPNAVLEAMAAGLPVVATAVGGTPEVVEEGVTGLLVPPGDPKALAEAITHLLQDPGLRQQMGQAGQKRVLQHFSIARVVERTQNLYQQLLLEKGLTGGQN